MKQFALAVVLILAPIALFFGGLRLIDASATAATTPSLGDLAPLTAIAADVEGLVKTGDLAAAETRATDLEKLWDADQATMRPLNPAAWGTIDDAADGMFHALRAATPDQATALAAVTALKDTLANPAGTSGGTGQVTLVSGIAVTDATGHALPCEAMLTDLRAAIGTTAPTGDTLTKANELLSKATERCNADDDSRADSFSAEALALLAH
jgi:hypothetical protein